MKRYLMLLLAATAALTFGACNSLGMGPESESSPKTGESDPVIDDPPAIQTRVLPFYADPHTIVEDEFQFKTKDDGYWYVKVPPNYTFDGNDQWWLLSDTIYLGLTSEDHRAVGDSIIAANGHTIGVVFCALPGYALRFRSERGPVGSSGWTPRLGDDVPLLEILDLYLSHCGIFCVVNPRTYYQAYGGQWL
jgi:hypothetical protein